MLPLPGARGTRVAHAGLRRRVVCAVCMWCVSSVVAVGAQCVRSVCIGGVECVKCAQCERRVQVVRAAEEQSAGSDKLAHREVRLWACWKQEGARDARSGRAGDGWVVPPKMVAMGLPWKRRPPAEVGSLCRHRNWEGVVSCGGGRTACYCDAQMDRAGKCRGNPLQQSAEELRCREVPCQVSVWAWQDAGGELWQRCCGRCAQPCNAC